MLLDVSMYSIKYQSICIDYYVAHMTLVMVGDMQVAWEERRTHIILMGRYYRKIHVLPRANIHINIPPYELCINSSKNIQCSNRHLMKRYQVTCIFFGFLSKPPIPIRHFTVTDAILPTWTVYASSAETSVMALIVVRSRVT